MSTRIPQYRVWDPTKKEIGDVYTICWSNENPKAIWEILANFKGDIASANPNSILLQDTGLKDLKNQSIYEGDLIDFWIELPNNLYHGKLVRGRVIWNSQLSHGSYGFVIIDEYGGIHSFNSLDQITIVGNTFLGITKTT